MFENKVKLSMRILVAVTFLTMIIVNALANILPINGQGTGQVSDAYPNLFAPAGLTFAIWGLIYLLLALYTLYQFGLFQKDKITTKVHLLEKIGFYFSISSIANAAWIFSWHYHLIPLSMLLIVVILVCLILVNQAINNFQLSVKEQIFIRLPFSVYFGWITVATIANATTLLVSMGWNGFGISESTWAIMIIITGMLIGVITTIRNRDIAYGLVLVWAYAGILIKHKAVYGFAGQYPGIITTVIVCIVLLLITEAYIIFYDRRKKIY
ncbi:MAG: lantibiotic ABC transporter permease [Firmicutes bacterium HGW-Firmicutes-12]|jgi:hypothetical protein|nr:MAG: lantibiotic ABC transporter permease [Firmicutes bacterium HGW-Firmicutes-12]